ncbi:hypothetical protein HEB94_001437 [Actinopolymorpha pittospori]|uniref:Uncharacterized protein n=1 Tax=Actinopolymorpha pittospori TaxID=648752 RepID=A0A927MR59_9ACTN|nr:hypothetical protein [Actinopolymorpha pittospori]
MVEVAAVDVLLGRDVRRHFHRPRRTPGFLASLRRRVAGPVVVAVQYGGAGGGRLIPR